MHRQVTEISKILFLLQFLSTKVSGLGKTINHSCCFRAIHKASVGRKLRTFIPGQTFMLDFSGPQELVSGIWGQPDKALVIGLLSFCNLSLTVPCSHMDHTGHTSEDWVGLSLGVFQSWCSFKTWHRVQTSVLPTWLSLLYDTNSLHEDITNDKIQLVLLLFFFFYQANFTLQIETILHVPSDLLDPSHVT